MRRFGPGHGKHRQDSKSECRAKPVGTGVEYGHFTCSRRAGGSHDVGKTPKANEQGDKTESNQSLASLAFG